jgi:tryptophan synthase alpha chain
MLPSSFATAAVPHKDDDRGVEVTLRHFDVTLTEYSVVMDTGPQRIANALGAAKAEGRAALLVCLPSVRDAEWAVAAARASVAGGADLLEFQTRFPQHPKPIVEAIGVVAREVDVPCLLWADDRVVHDFAITTAQPWRLVPACVSAGIAGIASPTPEGYAQRFAEACGADLAAINFVAPDMEPRHFEDACCYGSGFTYAIGVKTSPPTDPAVFEDLAGFLERVRRKSALPVFIGAGVATPEQATLVATFADGVAVAKAVFDTLQDARRHGHDQIAALESLVHRLRLAVERSEGR